MQGSTIARSAPASACGFEDRSTPPGADGPPQRNTARQGGRSMEGHRWRWIRLTGACTAALWTLAAAVAAPIDDWRASVTQTRLLADNDGVAAHDEALRLLSALPAGA